ncbi:hypothetical protein HY932_01760 [Candidatus Falkowbacteria bacterium]|nr:hypothetical protein [Candidatus Falkowbacteria bacterium]
MQKPYIKKIATISKFLVWNVDGKYIRTKIDEEFTNFGHHYRFAFIPKNEFWIDHESAPGEARFYIDHMLVEHRLIANGKSYAKALEIADRIEHRERSKSRLMKNWRGRKTEELIKNKIHKKLLKKYSAGGIKTYIVSGEAVRDFFFIDFTEGGHNKVYPFVPEKEIWIDDDVNATERRFVLLHEAHERHLMDKYGWNYDRAHQDSSKIEYFCRHHPSLLDKTLKKELGKNKI